MVTHPAPMDKSLTIHREATLRKLVEYTARLVKNSETQGANESAYAGFLAENVEFIGVRACWIIRSSINPSEQERILSLTDPWLHQIRNSIEERAHSKTNANGASETVFEWCFSDAHLTELTVEADRIVAETVRIEDSRRAWNSSKAPAVLFEDKLEDIRDKLMPERCLGPWIKFESIRQWLDHCDAYHAQHCQLSDKSKGIFSYHPKWLVDVERQCLVEASLGQRYLALSYVWGNHALFQTVTSNLEALRQDGALVSFAALSDTPKLDAETGTGTGKRTRATGIENLARTVTDVIEFVSRLGERYLWVDALCIVQDDDAHKKEHLAHMGSIYANAYATIVAINGSSQRGLYGIQNFTPAMQRARHGGPYTPSYVRKPGSLASAVQRRMEQVQRSAWSDRGWTFQEQIFSRRLIVLDDADITWECHCNVWLEGVAAVESQCACNTAVVAQGFSFHTNPKFQDYVKHVQQYNRRQFSYPEDSMDAFAGILTVLQTTFLGGFLCCLPVMFFDTALLWYNEGIVNERVSKRRREIDGLAPTWTWAAYGGKIAFPDFSTANEGVRPLVQWKYCHGDVKEWLPVLSLEKQQPEKGFPPAMKLHDLVKSSRLDHGSPVLAGEPEFPTGTGVVYHHLLHARPERAVFKVLEYYGDEGVPLAGVSGECVGMLVPCKKLGSHTVDAKTEISCELVAVSESFINAAETYNVLWVERKENVYIRKGVGRILKSDWVRQTSEQIDLLLV